jgi:hypothetical protein
MTQVEELIVRAAGRSGVILQALMSEPLASRRLGEIDINFPTTPSVVETPSKLKFGTLELAAPLPHSFGFIWA